MVRLLGRGFALILVAVVLALLAVAGAPQQAAARDRTDAVTGWIDVELTEIAAHRTNPPRASKGLALLSVAMLEATKVPPGQQEAAVAGAASTVLAYVYPDRAVAFASGRTENAPSTHSPPGAESASASSRTPAPTAPAPSGREPCLWGRGCGC